MNILLVDDDVIDRELFVDAINLVGKGYKVIEAENGQEAIDFLNSSPSLPQLIILDLKMPIKDGRETLKELKAHTRFKHIPICIMSTSGAHFDIIEAYENGANLFLVKPLDFRLLIEMLTSLLTLFWKHVALPKFDD
jgi:DNA-binding response OmpR family regulator